MSGLRLRPGVAAVHPYQPGKPSDELERELGIASAIKLASNENPLGPTPQALKAVRQACRQMHIYPDGSCFHLRQALAKFYRWPADRLLLGNGSNELLVRLGHAFLTPGDQVLTSEHSFVVYYSVPKLMDAELVTIPSKDWTFDLEAMAKALTPKTRIVYIANPNNPTGTVVAADRLKKFIARVPENCLVVLDEAYYEYADPRVMGPSLAWAKQYDNVVVLRTFSKAYGLAGLRIGYGFASALVCDAINRVREPFNVNLLAQAAALPALADQAHRRRVVTLARQERRRVAKSLERLGFEVVPSQTNFIFTLLPKKMAMTGHEFYEALLQHGIIIRPAAGQAVRITLGTERENSRLLQAITKISAQSDRSSL